MGTVLAIFEFLKKVLDVITPWSNYWVDKRKKSNAKKEAAQVKMDDAAKKGDYDSFLDARADKHSS